MVGRMYGRENVVGRNVQSEKSPSWKSPVGQVSVEEMSFGKVSAWDLFMSKCRLGNCTGTNLSVKLSQRNFYKEL